MNLSAAHTPSDFGLGQAEIVIRYGIPQWSDLIVKSLFEERILPLESPKFILEHCIKRPTQLLDVALIQSIVIIVQWTDWFTKVANIKPPKRFAVRFDRAQMSLDAATQGLAWRLRAKFLHPISSQKDS